MPGRWEGEQNWVCLAFSQSTAPRPPHPPPRPTGASSPVGPGRPSRLERLTGDAAFRNIDHTTSLDLSLLAATWKEEKETEEMKFNNILARDNTNIMLTCKSINLFIDLLFVYIHGVQVQFSPLVYYIGVKSGSSACPSLEQSTLYPSNKLPSSRSLPPPHPSKSPLFIFHTQLPCVHIIWHPL